MTDPSVSIPIPIPILVGAGALTGLFGSVLGLGGGVFLVPLLALGLGLDARLAVSASLVSVIATSTMTTALNVRQDTVNHRLALTLLLGTVCGGLAGGFAAQGFTRTQLFLLFSVTLVVMATVIVSRSQTRNVIAWSEGLALGPLDGTLREGDTIWAYRVRRLTLALAVSLIAGAMSAILGVGGGVIQVPILNSFCGVPIRVAAATSAFMIGPTASASALIYLGHGDLDPRIAGAVALGALPASAIGAVLARRAPPRFIKLVLAAALTLVALRVLAAIWFV
jgi:hypothetical protein